MTHPRGLAGESRCNICGCTEFETCAEGPVRCSGCRSLPRHRLVYAVLSVLAAGSPVRVLEVGGDGRFLRVANTLVVSLDALEHAVDDAASVRELARVARRSGAVLVTASLWAAEGPSRPPAQVGLPAFHIGLSGRWDCRCYRYYTAGSLLDLCTSATEACGHLASLKRYGIDGEYLVVARGLGGDAHQARDLFTRTRDFLLAGAAPSL
jgi:hypothetical protein